MLTTMWGSLAMATPPAGAPAGGGNSMMMIGYMVLIFGMFYFLMIRPQVKREKERRKMMDALKSGDRVIFGQGLLGTVTNVKEHTLVVKVADNVKIEVLRGAVSRVLADNEVPADVEKNA